MKNNKKDNSYYPKVLLKGMGMGAADVVPGVSGGTIAFITGIYEKLIFSIKSINIKSLGMLLKGNFKEFSDTINLPFLMSLMTGIAISVFSLAKIISYLLKNYAVLTWAFFFGLIIASAVIILKKVQKWNISTIVSLIVGIVSAYLITTVTPATTPDHLGFIFICGMIAICAMILPGISGAFLLLMLGKYSYMMTAIETLNIQVLIIFFAGAAIGIISFSNVLAFFLKNFHNQTISVLSGFMIGALNKVWPWKQTISTFTDRHGVVKPLLEKNISPAVYSELGFENYLWVSILLACIGFALIIAMEKIANKTTK